MGRRSRKRSDEPGGADVPEPPPAAKPPGAIDRMLARADERPKAPWHPFPLIELAVLVGIVLIVVGFLEADSARGRIALLCGLVLASLAGLDTAAREHFNGYRSHSLVLAGLPAVLAAGVLFFVRAPWIGVVAAGVAVFAAGFVVLRRAFRARAGVAFRA
ncbi:MAG TPA: hypothetical protein VM266_00740 [Solirubrobacteraceae bacterium]|nr:hypothetical protein [Solirubrobacteraceae bacterium]